MLCDQADFAPLVLKAWDGQLALAELIDEAARWEQGGQRALAAVLYRTWLERNNTPLNHFAQFNLGTVLSNAGDLDGARRAYLRAIELCPTFWQPRLNLGSVYEKLGQIDAALAEWRWIADQDITDQPDGRAMRQLALNHLGRVQELRRELADALAWLSKSLAMDPGQSDVLHHWVFLRAKQCEWPVYAPMPGIDLQLMRDSTSALAMIALSDDPRMQLEAARRYVRNKVNSDVPSLSRRHSYGHRRLRVGYLSSDFCLHPVALLTAELFELHDRNEFEIYGYCWTREDGSALRKRIIASMDHFERIDAISDEEAARRIRTDEIDILVDLHGQTLGARANLLAYRPAPIQVTYLGLPATTGLPCIDYVVADRFLIPEDAAADYSERPLYMPDVYQVSDRNRPVAALPSRADCGLPEDKFVFCSFNNNFKYTPEMFAVWMSILQRVPDSVLWLLADNPWAEINLRREASRLGIEGDRLLFAGRVAPELYLARYAVADLFLDTYPFNAGTTANDALWMELPVLTYTGRTFASRMAGALLTCAGLDELISYNLRDYEEKAVALANRPGELRRIRGRLHEVKQLGALFDTPRFVRHLESHFKRLVTELNG
jgi:predicted O-linked N-acetylglucosamine transferase (SPINDLY family)